MAAWITLTEDDVRLSPAEKAKLDQLKPATVDLAGIVTAAANFARGYIGAKYQLAEAPQVPPEVVDDVLAIALYNYLTLVPNSKLLDDGRKDAQKNALAHLRDISMGKATISPPDLPESGSVQGGASIATGDLTQSPTQSTRLGKKCRLDGLL